MMCTHTCIWCIKSTFLRFIFSCQVSTCTFKLRRSVEISSSDEEYDEEENMMVAWATKGKKKNSTPQLINNCNWLTTTDLIYNGNVWFVLVVLFVWLLPYCPLQVCKCGTWYMCCWWTIFWLKFSSLHSSHLFLFWVE